MKYVLKLCTFFLFLILYNYSYSQYNNYHAIIIYESIYKDNNLNLDGPKNDAIKLSLILSKKYNFDTINIKIIGNSSRREILQTFDEKRKQLSIDDNLLIFYAGHGYWENELKMGYWLPSDAEVSNKANWIANTDISTYISAFSCKHVLLISDACFSGGIFKTRGLVYQNTDAIERLNELKSRKAITSGNLKEVPDESILMKTLLKELEINKKKFLPADQLFSSIRPIILNNSTTEPQYGIIQSTGDEGGEFIFINKLEQNLDNVVNKEVTINESNSKNRIGKTEILEEKNKILKIPKRIAIIGFDNSGVKSELGELGEPLSDMLTSDLVDVKNIQMVDRQALQKILNEQSTNNSKNFDLTTATKIGKLLGAELILTGTYFEFMGKLRIDAKILNVENGKILTSVGADGDRNLFFDIKKQLVNKIIEKINQ
jgi:TolB-like protein